MEENGLLIQHRTHYKAALNYLTLFTKARLHLTDNPDYTIPFHKHTSECYDLALDINMLQYYFLQRH